MSHANRLTAAGLAIAMSLALDVSAVQAAAPVSDDALVASVKSALHGRLDANGRGIRVQAIDGTIYLYGVVDNYLERASVEDAASAGAQGHKIVDSIAFSPS